MTGFSEFSFGLRRAVVDVTGPIPPAYIDLHYVARQDLGAVATSVQQLTSASDACLWLCITGLIFGIIAVVIALLGAVGKSSSRGHFRQSASGMPPVIAIRIAAGLLAFDGLLLFIAIMIYTAGVMPNLRELAVPQFVQEFASSFLDAATAGIGMVASAYTCRSPYMCSGLVLLIWQLVFIITVVLIAGFGASSGSSLDDEARSMQMQMMHFKGKGKGLRPPMPSMGSKGKPPPMKGYGSQPPLFSGYAPPPGKGGPPPPDRSHPFEGGPSAGRMGPGYGAPPPPSQQGYGSNPPVSIQQMAGGKGYRLSIQLDQ